MALAIGIGASQAEVLRRRAAFGPDNIVIGGDNAMACTGGVRLWQDEALVI